MADNRGITALPLDIYTGAMPNAGLPDTEVTSILGTLSNTSRELYGFFQPELKSRVIKHLYQAVIDDDRKTVVRIATALPNLLLELLTGMPKDFVIESKYTFQKFDLEDENILSVAVKRKQIKMIEALLSCFAKLEQTDHLRKVITNALSQWSFYRMYKTLQHEDKIVIPSKYARYAKLLIDTFAKEILPNDKLSEETEKELHSLFIKLLPEKAVKLDNYFDVELFLLAVCRTAFFDGMSEDNTLADAFCIRVIGLIESVLTPETAKIFCEGLGKVVIAFEKGKTQEISYEANEHKLISGEAFYRTTRDSRVGLGFEFLCGIRGGSHGRAIRAGIMELMLYLEKLCQTKTAVFLHVNQQLQRELIGDRCSIL